MHHPPDQSTAQTSSSVCSLLPLFVAGVPASAKRLLLHVKLKPPPRSFRSPEKNDFYGPVQIPNEVTVALMTSPVHLGSKTSQEADDNQTKFLHFGVVQGCHKTRSPNPLLYLIHTFNNWILKPSTTSAYLPTSHHMCPTLKVQPECGEWAG